VETINNIELKDENIYPDETVLRSVIDKAYDVYARLLEYFDRNEMVHEWRYYDDGKAWLCKVQKKNRTVVWMSAWKAFFSKYFLNSSTSVILFLNSLVIDA